MTTTIVRDFAAGMGTAVAERTILRKVLKDGADLPDQLSIHPKDPDRGHVVRIAQEQGLEFVFDAAQEHRFGNLLRWETWGEVAHRVALGNISRSLQA